MANQFYRQARLRIADHNHAETINLLSDTIKVMLVDDTFTVTTGDQYLGDTATAKEIVATGYTGGFAGSGRKTLASKAFQLDTGNDRPEFTAADVSWTGLGGATNATIGGAVVYKSVTSDALSPIIAFLDTNNLTTNSSDVNLTFTGTELLLF